MRRNPLAAGLAALLIVSLLLPVGGPAQTLGRYDDFDGRTIDPARWRGYEETVRGTHARTTPVGQYEDGPEDKSPGAAYSFGARNAERRRQVVSSQLRLALTTWGAPFLFYVGDWRTLPKGRIGVRISDPELADHVPPIHAMAAKLTLTRTSVEQARPCPGGDRPSSVIAAGLVGAFFNDGSSRSRTDRTGDVMAALMARVTPDASAAMSVVGTVWRCADRRCRLINRLAEASFARTSALGIPITLAMRWQPDRTRFLFRVSGDDAPAETRALAYSSTISAGPPVGYVYDLRLENRPGACWWYGSTTPQLAVSSEARFDNVRLDGDAVVATE